MSPAQPDLLDALPDGVVVADGAGVVTAANARASEMLGVERPVGAPLAAVLRLQDTDGRDWVASNRPYQGLTTRTGVPEQSWLLPDGSEVLTNARLHRERRGGPVTTVAVTLRSGRGRARLDRERSDLVATVAHELRSPLTGVKGFVQALLNRWDKLSDEQKKLMLTTVSSDSDRLSRLIAELLDVARIDTGRLQLHARPSDAAVLTTRIVASVAAGTSRTIELSIADEDIPDILVDPDKFTQVVTNLVENAVRHGDGTVRVRVEPCTPDGCAPPVEQQPDGDGATTAIRVVVDDEGEGIAVELRRRVFTKFWKGGQRGGTGLGLYLAGGLVRAQGGTITIEDAPGGGARVVTTWPVGEIG